MEICMCMQIIFVNKLIQFFSSSVLLFVIFKMLFLLHNVYLLYTYIFKYFIL